MAFVQLWPPDETGWLPVLEVIDRLRDEFEFVSTDAEAGRDHIGDMICATLGFPDTLPWKAARIAELRVAQESSLYVCFGADIGETAGCCILPGEPLFFGNPDAIDGHARPLVERAAEILGYVLEDG